ncbi:MAG: hypothetical protein UT45_C0006G0096, partial [Candidatus Daviesbacteria bacterium GW2011_GWA2_39_33]
GSLKPARRAADDEEFAPALAGTLPSDAVILLLLMTAIAGLFTEPVLAPLPIPAVPITALKLVLTPLTPEEGLVTR